MYVCKCRSWWMSDNFMLYKSILHTYLHTFIYECIALLMLRIRHVGACEVWRKIFYAQRRLCLFDFFNKLSNLSEIITYNKSVNTFHFKWANNVFAKWWLFKKKRGFQYLKNISVKVLWNLNFFLVLWVLTLCQWGWLELKNLVHSNWSSQYLLLYL